MRVAGEAVARQAGIENGDLAAGAAELQRGGETGKAAADDDDVIHGEFRVVNGGGWTGPGAKYRPAIRSRGVASRASASTRESPITVLAGRTMPHSISPGGPGKLDLEDTYALACTFKILYGIVNQELGYCQGLELS